MKESSSNESFYSAEEYHSTIEYVSYYQNGYTWTIPMLHCSFYKPINRTIDLWEFFVIKLLKKNKPHSLQSQEDIAFLTS